METLRQLCSEEFNGLLDSLIVSAKMFGYKVVENNFSVKVHRDKNSYYAILIDFLDNRWIVFEYCKDGFNEWVWRAKDETEKIVKIKELIDRL